MNTNPMTPPSAGGVAGVQITEEMVERVCAAFAGDLTPAQARRWHKYFSGMLDADDLREVVRSAMSAAIESAAPAGDGVEHLGKDWTPQTMEARLYLMTGERDRYKAIAEQAREQIELRDCRIAELTATPAGGGGELLAVRTMDDLRNAAAGADYYFRPVQMRPQDAREILARLASTWSAPAPSGVPDAMKAVQACRDAELFEDGLSGDLASAGITTIAAAYMEGRQNACDEIAESLAAAPTQEPPR